MKYPESMYYNNPNHTKNPSLLISLLKSVCNVKGDIVEIGVYKAEKYMLFLDIAKQQGKIAHAIDSFRGFPSISKFDTFYKKGDLGVNGAGWLRKKTANKKNARIHEGFVPEILEAIEINTISFIHIDVDLYKPTKQSIKWAWPLLTSGGIMVCHDYLPNDERNCSRAIDEFINETKIKYSGLSKTWIWWIKK